MGISIERAERVLRHGGRMALSVVDDLPQGQLLDRAKAIRHRFDEIGWYQSIGGVDVRRSGSEGAEIVLVLVPDSEVRYLRAPNTFQTDSTTMDPSRILIRTASLTDFWAGVVLLHELSHALDYQTGVEPVNSSQSEFLRGETRAYQLEMALIDKLTSGQLSTALAEAVSEGPISATDVQGQEHLNLASQVEQSVAIRVGRPPSSEPEEIIRESFFVVAVLLASHWQEADAALVVDPEVAAEALGSLYPGQ